MSNQSVSTADGGNYWPDHDDDLPGDGLATGAEPDSVDAASDRHDSDTVEDALPAEPPKKKSRRTILLIIGIVFFLSITVAVAVVFLFPSKPKARPRPAPAVIAAPVVPEAPAEEASAAMMMDTAASSMPDAAAVAAATGVAAGNQGSNIAAPAAVALQAQQVHAAQTLAQSQPQGQVQNQVVQGQSYASSESVAALGEEVRRIKVSVDALMAAKPSAHAFRAAADGSQAPLSAQVTRSRPKAQARADKVDKVITEKAGETKLSYVSETQRVEFAREPRLKLRGVYPPQGEDQQAWVVDGERVSVVTKGDRVRGAIVLSVSGDLVKTTLGDIRY